MVEQERIRTEEKRRASEQKRLMKMQQEIELKEGLHHPKMPRVIRLM